MHEGEVKNRRDEASTQGTHQIPTGYSGGCSEGAQRVLRSPRRCGKRYLERVFHLSPPTLPINAAQGRPRAAQRASLRRRRTFEPATIPRLPPLDASVTILCIVLYVHVCVGRVADALHSRRRRSLTGQQSLIYESDNVDSF